MINSAIGSLCKNVPAKQQRALKLEAIRYTLRLNSAVDLNDAAREAGVFDEIQKDVKPNLINGTAYTLSKFWRAMTKITLRDCSICRERKSCSQAGKKTSKCRSFKVSYKTVESKYGVDKEDIKFSLDNFTPDDFKKIEKKYKKKLKKEPTFNVDEAFLEIIPLLNLIAKESFSFVIRNYPDITHKDIVHELAVIGYNAALQLDSMTDKEHFKNTVINAINQKTVNLQLYLTRGKRVRLEKDTETYEKKLVEIANIFKMSHLSKKEMKDRYGKYANYNYVRTVLSTDWKYGSNEEGEEVTIGDTLQSKTSESSIVEESVMLQSVLNLCPNDTYRRIIKILSGHPDSEYDAVKTSNNIYSVLAFFKVDKTEFFSKMKKALTSSGLVDADAYSKMVKETLLGKV